MWENGPQCDSLPNVRRDFPIYITGLEGREDIDWLLDDIAKDGDGPPAGGKRRLIQREGFASRISRNARPHDPGGGGTTRSPVPQNSKKMNLRKSPMDMNKNRKVKLMQISSQVAEKASSDGTTNKQCRPAHRQSTKTTVTEMYMNFADKPKPTLSQRPAVAAVEQYNFDLIEGMTLMTYTPPPRKNRRSTYEDSVKYVPEVQESNGRTSEMGIQTEEESPHLEPAVQQRTDADEDIPSCRDKKDNYGRQGRAGRSRSW